MTSGSTRRSRVVREDPDWERWLVALAILYGSGIATALASSLVGSPSGSMVLGIAILAGGGVLAARQLRPRSTPAGVIAVLLLPAPVALTVWIVVQPFADGDPEGNGLALGLYATWELSLAITAGVSAAVRRRARERALASGWSAAELEVASATGEGRTDTVVREYPDTEWGRSELRADRRKFSARGYVLVDLVSRAGAADGAAELQVLTPIPLIGLDTTSEPALIATFKHGGRRQTPADLPDPQPQAPAPAERQPTGQVPRGRSGRRRRAHP